MFNLAKTGSSVVDKLKEVNGLGTVKAIKNLEEHKKQPATFPAAFVALETGKSLQQGTFPTTPFSWSIIVKGRDGGRELLTAIDSVIDIMDGFAPLSSFQLKFYDVNFFEQEEKAISYKITFTCTAIGRSRSEI